MAGQKHKGNHLPVSETTGSKKQDPTKLSLLLDFPAELRDMVYDKVIENEPAQLLQLKRRRHLMSPSSIVGISKQVRQEFLSRQELVPAALKTTVQNFDFHNLMLYLHEIPYLEAEQFRKTDQAKTPPPRAIVVVLSFDPGHGRAANGSLLRSWTIHAGVGTEWRYEASPSSQLGPRFWQRGPWTKSVMDRRTREAEELRKIREALLR